MATLLSTAGFLYPLEQVHLAYEALKGFGNFDMPLQIALIAQAMLFALTTKLVWGAVPVFCKFLETLGLAFVRTIFRIRASHSKLSKKVWAAFKKAVKKAIDDPEN
jgi:hypothetical protein